MNRKFLIPQGYLLSLIHPNHRQRPPVVQVKTILMINLILQLMVTRIVADMEEINGETKGVAEDGDTGIIQVIDLLPPRTAIKSGYARMESVSGAKRRPLNLLNPLILQSKPEDFLSL